MRSGLRHGELREQADMNINPHTVGRGTRSLLWFVSALLLAGCDAQPVSTAPAGGAALPQVAFRQMQAVSIPRMEQLSGRVVAWQTSGVRPQVNGIIMERLFNEGDVVAKGQPLYRLDPRLYSAAVKQAEANLQMTRASASAANALEARYAPLVKTHSISQQDYTTAVANAQQARAAIAQAAAMLETAKINLEFATVTAPIGGRIGRSFYTPGALVTANQAEALATIQQLHPIYVDIQQTTGQMLALRQQANATAADRVPVRLTLDGGVAYDKQGSLEFSEATVDAETGSITLRARFPNPDNVLLPGMFAQASLSRATLEQVFLVPQAAMQRDAKGEPMVYLLDAQNRVSLKPVVTQGTWQQDWIVTDGLRAGDKVLTKGLVRVRPGGAVSAEDEASEPQTASHQRRLPSGS